MESLLETIILGIIQGFTEWLPISSTGHLRLAEHFLGFKMPILFDVLLHIGTLTVVLFFFRKDIIKILSAIARLEFKTEHGRLAPLIIVGTLPTALFGLLFFEFELVENVFQNILPMAIAFAFCGIVLYSSKAGKERTDKISYFTAIIIGVAQGVSIIPGISRSGVTIATALLLGIKREKAFQFSFLLSVPAILGALGLTVYTQFDELASTGLGGVEVLSGVIVAMLLGYLALKLLWKILAKRKFHVFAFYCFLLSAALITLGLSGF